MHGIKRCWYQSNCLKVLAILLWLFYAKGPLAAPSSEIQTLTVAFLYNFMKLSEWPVDMANTEFTLCVTEGRPFGQELDAISGKEIQNKPLKIRRLVPGDSPGECQLLFLPSEEKPIRMQEWLKAIGKLPVLTVSDLEGFLNQGGMIALISEDEHLKFDVNLELVERMGIKMSSQILQIANEVRKK
jgi:YfiR/HmsC-like